MLPLDLARLAGRQVVGRVGKNEVNRFLREIRKDVQAVAGQDLVERQI